MPKQNDKHYASLAQLRRCLEYYGAVNVTGDEDSPEVQAEVAAGSALFRNHGPHNLTVLVEQN